MDLVELGQIVDAIIAKRRLGGQRPHELLDSIHRKKLPAGSLPVIEPLLHIPDGPTYKSAIDMVGKNNEGSSEAADAVEAAWERSWKHGVPQACKEAFRALIRIGGNEDRLLKMIEKTMVVDNYAIHKECADALMKMASGASVLAQWGETVAGKCDCNLHQKLANKISQHLKAS